MPATDIPFYTKVLKNQEEPQGTRTKEEWEKTTLLRRVLLRSLSGFFAPSRREEYFNSFSYLTFSRKLIMGYTTTQIVYFLLSAVTLTTQVKLHLSPNTTAECNKQVVLDCHVSSSDDGLSVIRMQWFQNRRLLCHLNNKGEFERQGNASSGFRCEFKNNRLSLIFEKVKPLDSGNSMRYMCKLHSNQGILHRYTWIRLKECCKVSANGPVCTFTDVYPGGHVHWFAGDRSLTNGSLGQHTLTKVEKGGWLTILSEVEEHLDANPKCYLMSDRSGEYIPCTTENKSQFQKMNRVLAGKGAGLAGISWTALYMSLLVAFT